MRLLFKTIIMFLLILFFLQIQVVQADDSFYKPQQLIFNNFMDFYQEHISSINQSSCPMHPTCSGYAQHSFEQFNPFLAWVKTSDRLLRCSNDLDKYETVKVNGMIRYEDEVIKEEVTSLKLSSNRKFNLSTGNIKQKVKSRNLEAELLYEFARTLESSQKYDQALMEYRRLLSYYPQSSYKASSLEAIVNILYKQNKYLEMIRFAKKILRSSDKKIVNATRLKFLLGAAYFRIENFNIAREYFNQIEEENKALKDKSYILTGVSYVYEDKFDLAKNQFEKVNSESDFHNTAIEFSNLAEEGKKLDKKNPTVAGLLGITPGLGYFYSGYNQTALSSLVVNSLFFLGAKKAFENNNKALGILMGSFNFGFYAGNIYGSFETAKRKNRKVRENYLQQFQPGFNY